MSTEVRVPALGESITEAAVGRWLKKVGDLVEADEPLVEVETDKVAVEVPAPAAGVLEAIAVKTGDPVKPGSLLATIARKGQASRATPVAAAPEPRPQARPAQAAPAAARAASAAPARQAAAPAPARQMAAEAPIAAPEIDPRRFPPSVRRLIAAHGPEIVALAGRTGRLTKAEAVASVARAPVAEPEETQAAEPATAEAPARAATAGEPAPDPEAPAATSAEAEAEPLPRAIAIPAAEARETRTPLSRLRQTIARRLKEAQNTAAMLTTFNEVDMSAVVALRTRYREGFEKKHGVKLGFTGFFVKAVIQALKEIPPLNAEIDGTDIVLKHYYNIGVAVGGAAGLVVPVLRDADRLGLAGIERAVADLGGRARSGTLRLDDLQGGTFTVSNGGVYGSLMSTPILNAPQSGILGMHKIEERAVVVGGQVVARPMMYLALSYDHRIVDGKEAVTFLVRVKEGIEEPERLILDL